MEYGFGLFFNSTLCSDCWQPACPPAVEKWLSLCVSEFCSCVVHGGRPGAVHTQHVIHILGSYMDFLVTLVVEVVSRKSVV